MYCNQCGAVNADGSVYCNACGALLPEASAVPVERERPREVTGEKTNSMAVAGLVLGIVGIFLSILSILAVIFGAVGISQTGKPGVKGRGMAVAGLVLGIVGALLWVFWMLFFSAIFFLPV